MALVELKNVDFAYTESPVVRGLDLAVEAGQIVSIMGPSGCGKSTVLRLIAGLEMPTRGICLFNGASWNDRRHCCASHFKIMTSFRGGL